MVKTHIDLGRYGTYAKELANTVDDEDDMDDEDDIDELDDEIEPDE